MDRQAERGMLLMPEKLQPKQAIRAYCTQCLGMSQFNTETVRDCQGDESMMGPCALFSYRLGKRPSVKVFREFCLDCMGGSKAYVKDCETEDCECHPYRMGKNPALVGKRKTSEKGMEALQVYRDSRRDDTKDDQKPLISFPNDRSP